MVLEQKPEVVKVHWNQDSYHNEANLQGMNKSGIKLRMK